LGKLSLTAVNFWDMKSVVEESVCMYLQTSENIEYISIEFVSTESFDEEFNAICRRLSAAPFASKSLQTIILDFPLNCEAVYAVLSAIQNPFCLRKLNLRHASDDPLPAFKKHFASNRFWGLRELSVSSSLLESAEFMQLLVENTRIHFLSMRIFFSDNVLFDSTLLEEGWLTEMTASSTLPNSIEDKLRRNLNRHRGCSRTCLALIAMKRKKRMLIIIPLDLVRIIARYLWETRNKSPWDEAEHLYA